MVIRRAVAAVVLMLVGLAAAVASSASAQPVPASHQFTPNDPSWVRRTMSRGSLVRWTIRA